MILIHYSDICTDEMFNKLHTCSMCLCLCFCASCFMSDMSQNNLCCCCSNWHTPYTSCCICRVRRGANKPNETKY